MVIGETRMTGHRPMIYANNFGVAKLLDNSIFVAKTASLFCAAERFVFWIKIEHYPATAIILKAMFDTMLVVEGKVGRSPGIHILTIALALASHPCYTVWMDEVIQKLAHYQPPAAAVRMLHEAQVVFLTGIAGAGKNAILAQLLQDPSLQFIVSHTTRAPRVNHGTAEQDGKDYHFVSHEKVITMLDRHEFIEAKLIHGNIYGTSVEEIARAHRQGKVAITDIDVQGVAEYKHIEPNITAVFILPPALEVWQERLERRYGESIDQEDYKIRMESAVRELQEFLTTDYYVGLVNDDLDMAVKQARAIAHGDQTSSDSDQPAARAIAQRMHDGIKARLAEL